MNALVLARDAEIVSVFSQLFREKGIDIHTCLLESAAAHKLSSEKFVALVLDIDGVPGCTDTLRNLPRPNKDVVVMAVVTESAVKQIGSHLEGTFVVRRPLSKQRIREVLQKNYWRMLRDAQTYFRLTVALPVWIRRSSGNVSKCTAINLSQRGMAINTPAAFQIGEQVNIAFAILNTDVSVSAEGRVIWDDKHGKSGISFECTSASAQASYFQWLQHQFFMSRRSEPANPT
jgi:hypothetical protein